MAFTADAMLLLLVLLPGFVSSNILDHVVVRKPKDNFGKTIEALVFSFVIYAMVVGALGFPALVTPTQPSEFAALASDEFQRFVWGSLVLSVALPLVLGFLISTDLHMKGLRLLKVTTKTARDTTWLDVFSEQRRYVIANLSGQRRIFGWPMYYSNDRDEGLLYLYDPAWINEDGSYADLDVHGIFVVEPGSIESIEFTHLTEQTARPAEEEADDV